MSRVFLKNGESIIESLFFFQLPAVSPAIAEIVFLFAIAAFEEGIAVIKPEDVFVNDLAFAAGTMIFIMLGGGVCSIRIAFFKQDQLGCFFV